jgi:23S rRNA (uracil1939-C5)-methyltransferase
MQARTNGSRVAPSPSGEQAEGITATVSALADDARGIVRLDNKVVFVDGVLPDEEIVLHITKRRRRYDRATLVEILKPSPYRVTPPCEYFGLCGGCGLQHLEPAQQVRIKEGLLAGQFAKFGHLAPEHWLPPLVGADQHYRRKARLGVKYVFKKASVLVGFRERAGRYIADMLSCKTLDARFSDMLPELRDLIMGLSARERIPQIEVAAGDEDLALVLRHLVPLTDADLTALCEYGQRHQCQIYLQAAGPDSITPLWPTRPRALSYHLPAYSLEMHFRATDFIQVNAEMNRRMIDLAVDLLQLDERDRVLDLFCGLGNFTLPLARHAARVVGVEAKDSLLELARHNAEHNGIDNAEFQQADLYADAPSICPDLTEYNKLLLDPPRDGAMQVIKHIGPKHGPQRIVYVSCNPVTLARDSEYLVNVLGYRLLQAGVINMFPHTNHVESIALFSR